LIWRAYVSWLIRRQAPLLLLALVGARRSPFLGWIALAVLVPHSMIAHKEYRFIYPVIPLLMPLAGLGIDDLVRLVRRRYSSPKWAMAASAILVAALLLASVFSARKENWNLDAGPLQAARQLSQTADVCGLGLVRLPWYSSMGYANLHKNIPIFPSLEVIDVMHDQSEFNYLLSKAPLPVELSSYRSWKCWHEVCLYKRPGPCVEVPGYNINEILRQKGL